MVYAVPEKYHPFTANPFHYFYYLCFFSHLHYIAQYTADALVPMGTDYSISDFCIIVLWGTVTALPFAEPEKYRLVKTLCNWFCMEWGGKYLPCNVLLYY